MKVDKTAFKDFMKDLIAASGAMLGLFALCVIYGMIFYDYDPMTMFEAIKQDLQAIFS